MSNHDLFCTVSHSSQKPILPSWDSDIFLFLVCRCIGRWLGERSATCPLCKVELWDEQPEDSSDEEEAEAVPPAGNDNTLGSGWQQLVNMLSFNIDGGHENLVTATANQPPQEPQPQGEQQQAAEDLSSEPSFWRRLLMRRRRSRRTLAEQHGVTLNSSSLAEPLLQAENGQINNNTSVDEASAEPRPDPPEGGATEQE